LNLLLNLLLFLLLFLLFLLLLLLLLLLRLLLLLLLSAAVDPALLDDPELVLNVHRGALGVEHVLARVPDVAAHVEIKRKV